MYNTRKSFLNFDLKSCVDNNNNNDNNLIKNGESFIPIINCLKNIKTFRKYDRV